jgi:hypothetical protein
MLPLLALFVALLILSEVGWTQSSQGDHLESAPKIGNRFDNKEFQPTTNSLCVGANMHGLDCSSAAGIKAQDELERIRREIEQIEKNYPPPPIVNQR